MGSPTLSVGMTSLVSQHDTRTPPACSLCMPTRPRLHQTSSGPLLRLRITIAFEFRLSGSQSPGLHPSGCQGNACKPRFSSASGGANLCASTRRRPDGRNATALPARSTLTAGPCSNSLHPTVGRSFSRARGGMASTAASTCAPD